MKELVATALLMFAVDTDPLGGWGMLVIQGGALGLLGVLIIYILPKEAENNRKERETRENNTAKVIETLQEKFEQRNAKMVEAIEKQTTTLQMSNNQMAEKVSQAVADICRSLPSNKPAR